MNRIEPRDRSPLKSLQKQSTRRVLHRPFEPASLTGPTAELQADFILTELDLALTFCAIVRTSRNSEAMERRLEAAEKARESAVHFKGKTILAEDVNLAITEKLEQLQTDLANLRASHRASSR